MLSCIASLKKDDGAYANELGLPVGSVPATAAAMAVLHYLNRPIESDSVYWLLAQFCATGGCRAVPAAPMPDLLSTATALHALALNRIALDNLAEPTLDFIDTLWDGRGGFGGTQVDKRPDCEYTYYALLALGHLTAV
jgi:hypothetical protein